MRASSLENNFKNQEESAAAIETNAADSSSETGSPKTMPEENEGPGGLSENTEQHDAIVEENEVEAKETE